MGDIRVLVPLAEGFEEIEAVTIIDMLRRAGAVVVSAGLHERHVTGGHDIRLETDVLLDDVLNKSWDLIVLPGGGKGVENLLADTRILSMVQKHNRAGKETGAICAAPRVLEKAGITKGHTITIHPMQKEYLQDSTVEDKAVVTSDRMITGRSAGAAMAFALTLIKRLMGKDVAEKVEKGVISGVRFDT
ncbi:MAG: DJ-1/PfpI family protein [Candidatus Marinimicrobia bacterium]|nr:DJ-1/PfpI family protein [Candidatus Neomarinimicrobiota bacterium]